MASAAGSYKRGRYRGSRSSSSSSSAGRSRSRSRIRRDVFEHAKKVRVVCTAAGGGAITVAWVPQLESFDEWMAIIRKKLRHAAEIEAGTKKLSSAAANVVHIPSAPPAVRSNISLARLLM